MVTRKRWFDPEELMLSTESWRYAITQMRADNLIDGDLCAWIDAVEVGWRMIESEMTLDDPEQLESAEVAFRYAHYLGWRQHMDHVALADIKTKAEAIKGDPLPAPPKQKQSAAKKGGLSDVDP